MSFGAPSVSLYDASLPPPRQYSDKEIADTIDSAILFTVSFLLFSVFAKPLIKAIRQRIWNSRALKIQAFVLLAVVWWRRRLWFRKNVPKLAMVEDVLIMMLSLARSSMGPILDRLVPLLGVALLLFVVWMASGQDGITMRFHGVLQGPNNQAIEIQSSSAVQFNTTKAKPHKPAAAPEPQFRKDSARTQTKMLKLPMNMLSELVVAIDQIRAQNSPARIGVGSVAAAVAGAVRNGPASCPALAKRSARTAADGIRKTALALAQVLKKPTTTATQLLKKPVKAQQQAQIAGTTSGAMQPSFASETEFWMSRTSTVYHGRGCRHISSKMVPVASSDIVGRNLRPCSLCN